MTNKSTKRALISSIVSLLICFTMLLGTTFAWFTDSVVSGTNQIIAGNLDVEVYYGDPAGKNSISGVDTLFNKVTKWEPGAVAYENLTVTNLGTLALKYNMTISFSNQNYVVDADGNKTEFDLSDILQVGIVTGGITAGTTDRDVVIDSVKNNWKPMNEFTLEGILGEELYPAGTPDGTDGTKYPSSETVGIVIYWKPTESDNDYNVNNGKTTTSGDKNLKIDLGVTLVATQLQYEEDSFDNTYDVSASGVETIAEAEEIMSKGEPVVLNGCNDPSGILVIPADYNETVTIINSTLKSVQAQKDANIVILGSVTINAKTPAAIDETKTCDGSAISANGKINISGNGSLTAIADDFKGAAGIGGMQVTDITIKDVTIANAQGSYVYQIGTDTKYYKDAPEGGAAIGSGYNGANITLDNVTVTKAIGGSKAAGIGGRYWTGTNITINNSNIAYVEGGATSAGIGGARISKERTENGTTITITNSTVTAKGGVYGAGIGSGYDTHFGEKQPMCTINITGSTINATGGQYAAGVGTGYHNAALSGTISNSTITAVSGEKLYKDSYTQAQDIGFGVVDPTREGKQTGSKLVYNGETINIPNP